MHPAYSVIFFTTASGAGFGLLAILGVLAATGALQPDFRIGLAGFGVAFGLIVTGLLSSTAHLGQKKRAWRAFSQWRSSWLSREGVAACLTFVPGGLFALGWLVLGRTDGWIGISGFGAAIGAAITVYCTAMIYASLRPIAQWHNNRTILAYLLFSATSGAVLLHALLRLLTEAPLAWLAAVSIFLTLAGFALKLFSWYTNDRLSMPASLNTATGLFEGSIRSVEWPHTEENFLLKEMGFRVARKHEEKLRGIATLLAFVIPSALLLVSLVSRGPLGALAAALASISQLTGLLVERWLFFAEAKHTVTLYYGRP